MNENKSFPAWQMQKKVMLEPYWEAQALMNKYYQSPNPQYVYRVQGKLLVCWNHLRPYQSIFEKKKEWEAIIEELETMTFGVPQEKKNNLVFWKKAFVFICEAYKKLGITDVAKQEDSEGDENTLLEGLLG